jgi:hypothetical protein
VVDPSLLRLAAARGVTICFADLDGADGLWVPEERTVLVNRALSEREVAEVIEHELGHVAIDDGHADLDAGIVPYPPGRSGRWAAALTAAACFALVGGVTVGMANRDQRTVRPEPVVAPSPPPLTGPAPAVDLQPTVGADGRTNLVTATAPARSRPAPSASVSASPATRTVAPGTGTPKPTVAPPPRTATQSRPPPTPPTATAPPTTTPPTTDPTTPVATPSVAAAPVDGATGPIDDGTVPVPAATTD